MLSFDALQSIIEGDSQAKGLRSSRIVTSIPSNNQIIFVNQDNLNINSRLDTATNRLYRSISGGAETLMPYYQSSGINILGKNNKLFTYYDANEIETSTAANVRRVAIALIARTGSGSFADWQGSSEQASSIAVDKFQ